MTEMEEICDKIETAAREATRAFSRGNLKRAHLELDAIKHLAEDALKLTEKPVSKKKANV